MNLEFGDDLDKFNYQAKEFDVYIGDLENSLYNGFDLFVRFREHSPMSGIKISVWKEFYWKGKSEFDMVCLLGHLALKSIIGGKSYCKVTNQYWFSRMNGKRNTLEQIDSERLIKYNSKYYLRKIKDELEFSWNLSVYANRTRGFFVSYKLDFKELVTQVEKNRKKHKSKLKRKIKNQIISEVVGTLNDCDYR
jgi:hypothetical protein